MTRTPHPSSIGATGMTDSIGANALRHRAGREWSLFHVSSLRPTIAFAVYTVCTLYAISLWVVG